MRSLPPLHPMILAFRRPTRPARGRLAADGWRGPGDGRGDTQRLAGPSLPGLAATVVCLVVAAPLAGAQGLSGEEVYQSTCKTCHERGQMKAPVVGDRKAWGPLIKEGQATLTGVAWVGIRRMPPRGGNPDLTLEEFARATVHMANAAGASWNEPDQALLARIRAVEQRQLERTKK